MNNLISSASKLSDYMEDCDREDWAKTIRRMLKRHENNSKQLIKELQNLFQGNENLNTIVLQHAGVDEHYLSWNEKFDELKSDLARQIIEIKL